MKLPNKKDWRVEKGIHSNQRFIIQKYDFFFHFHLSLFQQGNFFNRQIPT